MNKLIVSFIFCLAVSVVCKGQDPRERVYNVEVMQPSHAPKPQVEGFAKVRIEEKLNRGVVAIQNDNGEVHVSWRLLKTDPDKLAFDVYRKQGSKTTKLNKAPLTQTTDFVDKSKAKAESKYWVVPIVNGKAQEQSEVASVTLRRKDERLSYRRVQLRDSVMPGRVGVADLNGDGELDFILLHILSTYFYEKLKNVLESSSPFSDEKWFTNLLEVSN